MISTATILFYDVVVAVHVMSIVIAFGVTFAYPVILPWMTSAHPEAMATVHEMQDRIGRLLIMPFGTLALLTGIYLASDRHLFGEAWVIIPMLILVLLLGLGGAFFSPRERALAVLARRDLATDGSFSDEYEAQAKVVGSVGALASVLVLIAIFFMVAKPFA
jgi:uncharacterized membrane protein